MVVGATPTSALFYCGEKENEQMSNTYDKSSYRIACGHATRTDNVEEPQFYCKTCTKCNNKFCSTFKRQVEPNYNRCFNHSNYNPIEFSFKPLENIEEIAEENDKLKCA